jgi:hypothetical protein
MINLLINIYKIEEQFEIRRKMHYNEKLKIQFAMN